MNWTYLSREANSGLSNYRTLKVKKRKPQWEEEKWSNQVGVKEKTIEVDKIKKIYINDC